MNNIRKKFRQKNSNRWKEYTINLNGEMKKKITKFYHLEMLTHEKGFKMTKSLKKTKALNYTGSDDEDMEN